MKKHIRFLCYGLMAVVSAFAQTPAEKELTAKADTFITTHRAQWLQLEQVINQLPDNSTGTQQKAIYQKHPFYRAYKTFLRENGDAYAAVRKAQFQQYATPPDGLRQLKWQQPQWYASEQEQEGMDLIALAYLRNFDPATIAQLAWNLCTTSLFATAHTPLEEAQHLYRLRDLYGTRTYARSLNDSISQVWSADRSMAVTFQYNLRNGVITAIRYSYPGDPSFTDITWPASVTQPADSLSQLSAALWDTLWKHYPGKNYKADNYAENLVRRNEVLQQFYRQHLPEIVNIRAALLQQLPQTLPQLTGYKEHKLATAELLQHADTSLYAACIFHSQQWASIIAAAATYLQEGDDKTKAVLVQRNALFPTRAYARPLHKDEWQVRVVREADAVDYTWNIQTGNIANVVYYTQKQP